MIKINIVIDLIVKFEETNYIPLEEEVRRKRKAHNETLLCTKSIITVVIF